MTLKKLLLLIPVLFNVAADNSYADLGRLKRYIIRDCEKAESVFEEAGLGKPDLADRAELLRYLGEVFRLNLGAQFEAPLVAGNLADPSDIWRSLSGESEVDSKRCALRLAIRIGPDSLNALAPAIPLLTKATTPLGLRTAIVTTIFELWSKTEFSLTGPEDGDILRAALRELSASKGDFATAKIATALLIFGIDSSFFPRPQIHTGESQKVNEKGKTKDRRPIFKALASSNEAERENAVASVTESDLKALEGFRVIASRTEKVAASLAISHLGGKWSIDPATSKSLDCNFAASFIPLTAPSEPKRREDFERLIARCLLVGRYEFISQIVATPQLGNSAAIKAMLTSEPNLKNSETGLSISNQIFIVLGRLQPDATSFSKLVEAVCALLRTDAEASK